MSEPAPLVSVLDGRYENQHVVRVQGPGTGIPFLMYGWGENWHAYATTDGDAVELTVI